MKNTLLKQHFLFPIFLSFLSIYVLPAQSLGICGVTGDQISIAAVSSASSSTDPLTLRLYVYILRDDLGQGGISNSQYESTMAFLNTAYTPHNIFFTVACIKNLPNSTFLESPGLVLYSTITHSDGLTIFLADNSYSGASGRAEAIGGTRCWARGDDIGTKVLAHEIGHLLNLYHTFHGSPCREPVLPAQNPFGDPLTTGDMIEDTSPDKGITYPTDCITYINDLCAGLNYPNPGSNIFNNIMSGAEQVCRNLFTANQRARMRDHILAAKTGLLVEGAFVMNNLTLTGADKYYNTDIVIKAPNTLTVSCTLHMAANRRIIVQPGAKFILDNGVLSNWPAGDCNGHDGQWGGINIELKITNNVPSTVILNGGTIEHAIHGIYYHGLSIETLPGIFAYSTKFINNTTSLHFTRESFTNPSASSKQITFQNCEFTTNSDFIGDFLPFEAVKLSSINKTVFWGCKFKNLLAADYLPISEWYGVTAFNTTLTVNKSTAGSTSEFEGFTYGVHLSSIVGSPIPKIATIKQTDFSNCEQGIRLNAMNHPFIFDNNFTLNYLTNDFTYGAYLDACDDYTLRQNQFNNIIGVNAGVRRGIFVSASGAGSNLIYNNYFNALKRGIYCFSDNSSLQLLCNHNNNLVFGQDIYVEAGSSIAQQQGNLPYPAGNTFSSNTDFDIYNFPGNSAVKYFYFTLEANQNPNPISSGVSKTGSGNDPLCDDAESEGDDNLTDLRTEYNQLATTFNSLSGAIKAQIDGGNTASLLSLVQSATAGSAATVYTTLQSYVPYLSAKVSEAAFNRFDIFSNEQRFQILYNNPDNLFASEFMEMIQSSVRPLSSANLTSLEQARSVFTPRTNQMAEIAHYDLFKNIIADKGIRLILEDSVVNFSNLREWLGFKGDFQSKLNLADTYLQENTLTTWQQQVAVVANSNLTDRETSDLTDYISLVQTIFTATSSGRNIAGLNQTEIDLVEDIALSNERYVSRLAKNILEAYYGYHFTANMPQGKVENRKYDVYSSDRQEENGSISKLKVYPNPAEDIIIFDATGQDFDKGGVSLDIYDAYGALVISTPFDAHQIKINTRSKRLRPGIYYYKLNGGASCTQHGKFIIR